MLEPIQSKPFKIHLSESKPLFFTSDLHFFHKRIVEFTSRPTTIQQHNDWVINQINNVVPKTSDTLEAQVYHLGDFLFSCTNEEAVDVLKQLNGTWNFVLGNHCVDKNTELLTKEGWKFANKITKDDLVATVDLETNTTHFHNPQKIIENKSSQLYTIKAPRIDAVVSSGHNIVINRQLKKVSDCVGKHHYNDFLLTTLNSNQKGIEEDLNWLRLIVQVVCDATLVRSSSNKCRVQFKLSKQRKIDRLENLLIQMNTPYTKQLCKKTGTNKLQPYYIRIYGQYARDIFKYLKDIKQFPKHWTNINKEELEVILHELSVTDGTVNKVSNVIKWHTINKNDVDVIQQACVINQYKFYYNEVNNLSGFTNGKLQYACSIDNKEFVSPTKFVEILKTNECGLTYGVTMNHGTIITRRNGKVWVTGNCNLEKLQTVVNTVNLQCNTKHRILGWYYRLLVVEPQADVSVKAIKKQVVLCHFPIEEWDSMDRFSYHLFGHMHGGTSSHSNHQLSSIKYRLDVGIDNNSNHKPFSWEDIRTLFRKQKGV